MHLRTILSVVGLVGLLSQGAAWANNDGGAAEHPQPPGPPREALEACKGKQQGDSVTIKDREGRSMKAECRLIAVPERPAAPPKQ